MEFLFNYSSHLSLNLCIILAYVSSSRNIFLAKTEHNGYKIKDFTVRIVARAFGYPSVSLSRGLNI